jgi:glyoxylase-like metal-dependent hydrolase (beta-lactamase superfamily II)
VVLAGPPTPLATPAPVSLIREGVTERLTQHVWAIPDGQAGLVPNVGIVVGSRGVLVVDTGLGRRNGEAVLREVQKVAFGKAIWIVSTHFHPEHDFGAVAFPAEAKMIRSRDQIQDIAEGGMQLSNVFAARSPLNAELLQGAAFRPADITFDSEYVLDLGGVRVRLIAMGLNHTRGDTVAWVEPDRVLFTGDVAMRPQPSLMNPAAGVSHWLGSLDKLEALHPLHVVPSHGLRGDASIIGGYRTYLTRVRDRVAVLKGQGKSVDETVQIVTDEMAGQYPDRARLGGAVRAAYQEAR